MIGLVFGASLVLAAEIGQPAPDFTLPSVTGEEVTLSQYRGKTVVLEWFNPGCPFVKYAHGEGVVRKDAEAVISEDIVWLAINSSGPGKQGAKVEDNKAAVESWSIKYPVLLDPSGSVGKSYDAKTTPQIAIVNSEGLLVYNGALDNAPMGKNKGDHISYVANAVASIKAGQPIAEPSTKPYGCSVKYSN
jgi:hypothetical protein